MNLEEARRDADKRAKQCRADKATELDRLGASERAKTQLVTTLPGVDKDIAGVAAALKHLAREAALAPDDVNAAKAFDAAMVRTSALAARREVITGELIPDVTREIEENRRRFAAADAALTRAEQRQALVERAIPADMRVEAAIRELASALASARTAHAAAIDFANAGSLYHRVTPGEVLQLFRRYPESAAIPLDAEDICAWRLTRLEQAWAAEDSRSAATSGASVGAVESHSSASAVGRGPQVRASETDVRITYAPT